MVSGIGYNPSIPPSNGIMLFMIYDPKQQWLQQLVFQGWFMALGLPNGSNPYHCYLATRGDYRNRQNYGKKKVSIYRRRLSMIEKLRTFFFPIFFSIIIVFSIILSVTVCPSIRDLTAF